MTTQIRGGENSMDSDQLARHYSTLTARERLPLLLAARVRGDDVETERLLESAPRELWRVPHHQNLVEAVCDLALLHFARLMDVTARLWRADLLYETHFHCGIQGRKWKSRDRSLSAMIDQFRNELLVLEEAWKRFCGELLIDPEALFLDLPGYPMVRMALDEERRVQPAGEPAAPDSGFPPASPNALAAAAIHAGYRAALARREGTDAEAR